VEFCGLDTRQEEGDGDETPVSISGTLSQSRPGRGIESYGRPIVELRGEEGDGDAPQQEEVLPGETGVGEGNVVISPDVEPQDGKPNPATDQCLTKEVRQHPGGEVAGTRAPDKQDILQANPADLREWQQEDPSLERAQELASENPVEKSGDRVRFVYQDGLLY